MKAVRAFAVVQALMAVLTAGIERPLFHRMKAHRASSEVSVTATVTNTTDLDLDEASEDSSSDSTEDAAAAQDATSDASADSSLALPEDSATISDTLSNFNAQAKALQARIAQARWENDAKLAREKAVYEQKLKQQDETNKAIIAQNKKIQSEIDSLKGANLQLKKHSMQLQEDNRLMRTELKTVEGKFAVAGDFIKESLKATDDHSSEKLAVTSTSSVKHRVAFSSLQKASKADGSKLGKKDEDKDEDQDDDSDEDNDSDDSNDGEDSSDYDDDSAQKGVSFLALRAKVKRATTEQDLSSADMAEVDVSLNAEMDPGAGAADPQNILKTMSSGVDSLTNMGLIGESMMKKMFLGKFKAGAKRRTALLAQQKKLKDEEASLQALQKKLKDAELHFEGTKEKLKERLHKVGVFLQQLGHLAVSPVSEAPQLLKALPESVSPQ